MHTQRALGSFRNPASLFPQSPNISQLKGILKVTSSKYKNSSLAATRQGLGRFGSDPALRVAKKIEKQE